MAKKFSQLNAATSLSDSDTYPIVQSGINKKVTGKQVSQHYTDFTTLSGTVWDGSNKVKNATANLALTFSPGTNRFGQLIFIQDATGGRTLSIEGNSIAVVTDANAVSVISYVWDLASTKFRFFIASSTLAITGTAPDTTAPTVSSRATGSTTTIVITFSENVTSTTAGWSFKKNGSALAISSVSGSGTNQLTFTVATMASGDTLLCSYNSGTGDCKDAANNLLASFTDQSVTNGIAGLTQLATPTLTATVISDVEIDLSWTNVANESSYKLEWSANGTTGWTQIGGTIAANTTTYNHTGLTASTHYYYRVTAVGDGTTYSDSNYGTDDDTTSAPSYDTDAQAYFTAEETLSGGSMTTTEKDAVNTLVLAFKSAGVWTTKLKLGGTFLRTGTLNLKDPSNTDGAFRLTQGAGSAASFNNSTGWTFDGVNDYLRTHLIPSTALANHSECFVFAYSTTATGGTPFGGSDGSNSTYSAISSSAVNGDQAIEGVATNIPGTNTLSGRYVYGRVTDGSLATKRMLRNGTQIFSGVDPEPAGGAATAAELYLGGYNNNGASVPLKMTGTLKGMFIFTGLTNTEQDAVDTAVANYLTALGR